MWFRNRTGLGWRTLLGAWYVDDTIRLRPNLTLEAGHSPRIHDGLERGGGTGR